MGSRQGLPASTCIKILDNWDNPAVLLRAGILWAGHSNHGVPHAAVIIDHVEDNLFHTIMWNKIASIYGCLS